MKNMKISIIDTLGLTYDGDTLKKRGLGGSESAVILMSAELVKLGYDVTVYNNCIDSQASPGVYDGVRYIDHTQAKNPEPCDIVISSRSAAPFWNNHQYNKMVMKSRWRILWMHDTFCEGDQHLEAMVMQGFINEVFTLSDFHSWYVTSCDHGNRRNFEVLKHKFFQTRNGAVKHIQNVDLSKKDSNHFVYNASATKGLIPLVKTIWPKIKSQLPDAKLTCIGGFYRFREGAEPDAQEKMVNDLITSEPPGVFFTGVIPQYEIAEILANATLMLYPTAFPETFGISSLESLLYKTPIVTHDFGALEETAIAQACYKIPYSATNNALFKNINEEAQADRFVQTVVNAVKNPYLLYQKQNYCDVVTDVHGWDTVALQWDQHFHNVLKKPYPVSKYRKVNRINQDVSRIFGRRFNNSEDRKSYTSYGEQQRIVVISPFRNARNYLVEHIRSVAQQDYDNYLHILIDDASEDRSGDLAQAVISKINPNKTVLIKQEARNGCIKNQLAAVDEFVDDNDIVMFLDGDDSLINNNTLFHFYNDLYHQGYDFTYGSMWSLADNIPLIAQDYTPEEKYPWKIPYTHLRTMSGSIAKKLNKENYIIDGEWMRSGADNPMFRETISYAKNPKAVKEIMVNYNDLNPLNDYKINGEEQNRNASTKIKYEIKTDQKPNIPMIIEQEQSVKKSKQKKKILIAIPTNRYIEPQTMKSIYDLTVPDGYTTEFQFFYGYSRSQIRNLIAEWAKRYDYTIFISKDAVLSNNLINDILSVDSDIVKIDDLFICVKKKVFETFVKYPYFEVAETELDELNNFVQKAKTAGAAYSHITKKIKSVRTS